MVPAGLLEDSEKFTSNFFCWGYHIRWFLVVFLGEVESKCSKIILEWAIFFDFNMVTSIFGSYLGYAYDHLPWVCLNAAKAKSLQHLYYDVARAASPEELWGKPIFRLVRAGSLRSRLVSNADLAGDNVLGSFLEMLCIQNQVAETCHPKKQLMESLKCKWFFRNNSVFVETFGVETTDSSRWETEYERLWARQTAALMILRCTWDCS